MEVKRIRIDQINVGQRFRKEYGDIKALGQKIKAHKSKLLQPIIVSNLPGGGYKLHAGGRRLRAMREIGESMIPAVIMPVGSDLEALMIERDENERLDLAPSEKVALGQAIEEALGKRRGERTDLAANAGKSKGETADIVAEAVGFGSGDTYERAKEVVVNGTPELVKAMDAGEVSISAAAKQTREKPSDADETLHDEAGHVVPAQTVPAFNALATFREIDALIRQLQKKLDELARVPGGEQLKPCLRPTGTEDKVLYKSEDLNALKRHLNGTRPYSICSYCAGKAKKDCKGCSGRGWVSRSTWENTADDLKARIA